MCSYIILPHACVCLGGLSAYNETFYNISKPNSATIDTLAVAEQQSNRAASNNNNTDRKDAQER